MEAWENNSWTELEEDPIPMTRSEMQARPVLLPRNMDQTLNLNHSDSDRESLPLRPPNPKSAKLPKQPLKYPIWQDSIHRFGNVNKVRDANRKSSICIIDNIKLRTDSIRKRQTGNKHFQSFNINFRSDKQPHMRVQKSNQLQWKANDAEDTSGSSSSGDSLLEEPFPAKKPVIKAFKLERPEPVFRLRVTSPPKESQPVQLGKALGRHEKVLTPRDQWVEDILEEISDDLNFIGSKKRDLESFHLWIRMKYYRKLVKKLRYPTRPSPSSADFQLMCDMRTSFKFLGQNHELIRRLFAHVEDSLLGPLKTQIRSESFESTFFDEFPSSGQKPHSLLKKIKCFVKSMKKEPGSKHSKIKATEINIALHETNILLMELEDSLKKSQMYLSFGNEASGRKLNLHIDSRAFRRVIIEFLLSKVSRNIGGFTSKMLKTILFSLLSSFIRLNSTAVTFLLPDLKIPHVEQKILDFAQSRLFKGHSKKVHFILLKFNCFLAEITSSLNRKLHSIFGSAEFYTRKDFAGFEKTCIGIYNCLEEIQLQFGEKPLSDLDQLCRLSGMDLRAEIEEYLVNQEDYTSGPVHVEFAPRKPSAPKRPDHDSLNDSYMLNEDASEEELQVRRRPRAGENDIIDFVIPEEGSSQRHLQKGTKGDISNVKKMNGKPSISRFTTSKLETVTRKETVSRF